MYNNTYFDIQHFAKDFCSAELCGCTSNRNHPYTFLNIQHFASGVVVHGTEQYVNSVTPSSSEAYVSTGTVSGLSAEMKTFYDKTLIELASPSLVHDQFGQKRSIPAGGGKSIEFRKFNTLPKAMKPITEGVTPNGNKLTVVPINATVDQYGDYVELTDMLELTSIDPIVVEATRQLADQAGRTLDTVVRNQIIGGTNVMYCPKFDGTNYTDVTSRASLDNTAKLRVKDVFKAAALLKAMNAPTFDGSYVAIIHPYVAYDLMQEAGSQWSDITKYTNPSSIMNGEIGTLGGVRFVQTSEAKIYTAPDLTEERCLTVANYTAATKKIVTSELITTSQASALAGRYVIINGERLSILSASAGSAGSACIYLAETPTTAPAAADVIYPGEAGLNGTATFATLFLGANAYGVTDVSGGGIEHIIKQKGYGNDPLNQRSSVGWKALKVAVRLVEEYMIRVESGSSFSTATLAGN